MVLCWKSQACLAKEDCRSTKNHNEDLSQIPELLKMIKNQRDAGVTGVVVMFSWIGRRMQPLQKQKGFGFEYLGISDPS